MNGSFEVPVTIPELKMYFNPSNSQSFDIKTVKYSLVFSKKLSVIRFIYPLYYVFVCSLFFVYISMLFFDCSVSLLLDWRVNLFLKNTMAVSCQRFP